MKKPLSGIALTMEAMCHFFDVKPVRKKNPDGPGMIQVYWDAAKKHVSGGAQLLLMSYFAVVFVCF